jgi:cellulose biosynthesis protein BcsQ
MSKITLITNQKGGGGKLTIAYNLAKNFSRGAKVAVLDFDRQ